MAGNSNAFSILERLVSFPTVSADGNRELIDYVASQLSAAGISFKLFTDPRGDRSSLFARVGPDAEGGVVLSGHTDVVPVIGQAWSTDPFRLTRRDRYLLGRGTADMKGFVACAMEAMLHVAADRLVRPLYLALSYDEEIGCVGVRPMLEFLESAALKPDVILVGEPTSMNIATGHKGKVAVRAHCCGVAAHSALAPKGMNAIHLAADFLSEVRSLQAEVAETGLRDPDYDIPYSTIHAGVISGGTALNIVPESCVLDFEIRNIAEDDPKQLFDRLFHRAEELTRQTRQRFPSSGISLDVVNEYPGLKETSPAGLKQLVQAGASEKRVKVAFGTEGGLFSQALRSPVLVCGPGSMDQGHRADEFLELDQFEQCRAMLKRLTQNLSTH